MSPKIKYFQNEDDFTFNVFISQSLHKVHCNEVSQIKLYKDMDNSSTLGKRESFKFLVKRVINS